MRTTLYFSFLLILIGGLTPCHSEEITITPEEGFASAVKRVSDFRSSNPNYTKPVVVTFADGMYVLPETIVLDASVSGTEQSPTVFRATAGSKPVFSGGTVVSDWTVDDRGYWVAPLPDGLTGLTGVPADRPASDPEARYERHTENDRAITQLFVNQQRRFRPRLPKMNQGYFFIAGTLPPSTCIEGNAEHNNQQCSDRFQFGQVNGQNEIPASFENVEDVEVFVTHHWNASRLPIRSIDPENRIIQTAPVSYSAYWAAHMKDHPYFLDNVKESLGQPGDWYYDRKANQITYVPKEGETIKTTEVVIPRLSRLLTVGRADSVVEHVRFEGLTFAFAAWSMPETGVHYSQAEHGMAAAVNFNGARNVTVDTCCFRHFGGYGIEIAKGSEYNTFRNCDLVDVGAGGIKIRGDHNTVIDSTIRGIGRIHPAGIGVMIGHACYNTIQNCDIFDLYYSSTSIGWTWGYGPSEANHNIVSWNHMYKIGQGVLSDMGAVYTLGISPGTRVEYNRIHDVNSFSYGGWGLYTDEGSTGVVMRGNTVFRCKSASFHQHYGRENIIEDNIFVDAQQDQIQRTRSEDHLSFYLRRNVIAWHSDNCPLGSNWGGDKYVIDDNLYYTPNHDVIKFPADKQSLDAWRERGHDLRSLINVDPLFVDWSNDDYRLQPNSPAYKLGFQNPPTDNTPGRRTKTSFENIPEVPSAFADPKATGNPAL